MDSNWAHHAETYHVAGTRRIARPPVTAQRGRARRLQPTMAAIAKSATTAGSLISASAVESPGAGFRSPGATEPRIHQIQGRTGGKEIG